jgi:hypothetical protein
MPRVQPILREFEKRKQDEAWETAKDQIIVSREFLDELFIERLVNMKTHPKLGDLAIVKMFETGYKRTGDIQPARITAAPTLNGKRNCSLVVCVPTANLPLESQGKFTVMPFGQVYQTNQERSGERSRT